MNIQIGQMYKIKNVEKCAIAKDARATHVVVYGKTKFNSLYYNLYRNGKVVDDCSGCLLPKDLELLEKRLEYMHCMPGDIVLNEYGDKIEIIQTSEDGVWVSSKKHENIAEFCTWERAQKYFSFPLTELTDEDNAAIERVKQLQKEGKVDITVEKKV